MRTKVLLFILLFLPQYAFCQYADSLPRLRFPSGAYQDGVLKTVHVKPGVDYVYIQPPKSRYYNFLVKDFSDYFKVTFRDDKIPYIGAMAITTGFLVNIDQSITDFSYHVGDKWGIGHTNKQKPLFNWKLKIGGQSVETPLNFPQDLESGMYFLGDGIVHSGLAVGLWGVGKITDDDRAVQTGTQLMEAIICTGITIQVLKHSFGRETYTAATAPGGKWRPFPNPAKYQRHVPNYDAMPSGHIATATATVTVIADNYPEKKWIRPVGYTLMGALMYAMLNNGVHWASDYPLGISIGYTFAKIADSRSKAIIEDKSPDSKSKHSLLRAPQLSPYINGDATGLSATYHF